MENYIILIAIPLILFAFLAFGLFMVKTERKIRSKGIKTKASVIEIKKIRSQQDVSYELIVEFVNSKGETIVQALDNTVSNHPKEELPFERPIIYLESDGKRQIILANNKTMLYIGMALTVFSIAMLILFVFYALENL